jgi:hypothetical protein
MIEPESYEQLKREIRERISEDRRILDILRSEIRILKTQVRPIQPRTTTAISLVGTDGGNNSLQFDPFIIQLVRVVDSSNNEYSLEAITPSTNIDKLSEQQLRKSSPLGQLMNYLGVRHLSELSNFIQANNDGVTWVKSYREIVEWATLFSILRTKDFGTDTLIVFDGLLRTKHFAKDYFKRLRDGFEEAIENQRKKRRKIYIAGVAKHSQVLNRYRLAMALEGILLESFPAFAEVPREIEKLSYKWAEFSFEDDKEGEINKYVGGKLFFVKFGSAKHDPVWPIDILVSQVSEAQSIIGYMLADALNGFPVPYYPLCLQKAHDNAALVGFDFDILQDQIFESLRSALGDESQTIDIFRFQDLDPSRLRYE